MNPYDAWVLLQKIAAEQQTQEGVLSAVCKQWTLGVSHSGVIPDLPHRLQHTSSISWGKVFKPAQQQQEQSHAATSTQILSGRCCRTNVRGALPVQRLRIPSPLSNSEYSFLITVHSIFLYCCLPVNITFSKRKRTGPAASEACLFISTTNRVGKINPELHFKLGSLPIPVKKYLTSTGTKLTRELARGELPPPPCWACNKISRAVRQILSELTETFPTAAREQTLHCCFYLCKLQQATTLGFCLTPHTHTLLRFADTDVCHLQQLTWQWCTDHQRSKEVFLSRRVL